jgi:hypothetical protein
MPKQILAFCGKKESGKSTAARILTETLGFIEISFAEPLKEACRAIFGLDDDQLYGNKKECMDPRWNATPREILQRFGTDVMRSYSNLIVPISDPADIWLLIMRRQIEEAPEDAKIVISDCRFANEADLVRCMGGCVIEIRRSSLMASADTHVSEQMDFTPDFEIDNDKSLSYLSAAVILAADVCAPKERPFTPDPMTLESLLY